MKSTSINARHWENFNDTWNLMNQIIIWIWLKETMEEITLEKFEDYIKHTVRVCAQHRKKFEHYDLLKIL